MQSPRITALQSDVAGYSALALELLRQAVADLDDPIRRVGARAFLQCRLAGQMIECFGGDPRELLGKCDLEMTGCG
jgi:hypothetical protein